MKFKLIVLASLSVLLCAAMPASAAAAASSSQVRQAQSIMTKFGLPTGPVDGIDGSQTDRALCAARVMTGAKASRDKLNGSLLSKLKGLDKRNASLSSISAPKRAGQSTYVYVNQTCQVMFYVENGHYKRVFAVSTGRAGHRTPNGTWTLGSTQKGWSCSTLYPESCSVQSAGMFSNVSNYGNMYNRRLVNGDIFVHGSMSVPTYPDSHGCIRVSPKDSDTMFKEVGNHAQPKIIIDGAY